MNNFSCRSISVVGKSAVCCWFFAALTVAVNAQPQVIPLWPGGPPGTEDWTHQEQEGRNPGDGFAIVRNVTEPTLTAYVPDPAVANGTAAIVAPGGAFHFLSIETEGEQVARWLNTLGVTAFVLKYRLIPTAEADEDFWKQVGALFTAPESIQERLQEAATRAVADGRQAVKLVRAHASEWGIAPDRIGMVGFSAGSTVTEGAALSPDTLGRPDFAAAIYGGVLDMGPVPGDAPPLFIVVAGDDELAAPGSVKLYESWKAAGRPVELHVYSTGGHGFGMKKQGLPIDSWPDRLRDWLHVQGLLERPY